MPIWGIVNQKGGVGKTTTAVNMASGLAERGKRVLLVDADPQGNATSGVGVDKSVIKHTLLEVFQEIIGDPDAVFNRAAILKVNDNLDVIPATLDLAGAEPLLIGAVGKELILRDCLEQISREYDWVLIDAPPSLGILTINILGACDAVVVPMQCEFYALEGLSQLIKTIDVVRRRINPKLEIAKVILTMYDARNKLTQQVADDVTQYFGDKVSSVPIPRNVRLSEAPGFGAPAVELFPDSKGAEAYMKLVDEVLSA